MNAGVISADAIQLSLFDTDSPWAMVFREANLAMAVLAPDFGFLRVNDAFAMADAKRAEDFVGRNFFAMYPHRATERLFRRVLASGESFSSQAAPFCGGNNPRRGIDCWNWTLVPVRDGLGAIACLALVMQDVSARIRAEELARLGENDVRNLLYSLPGMIYRYFPDWSTDVLINAEQLTGYSSSEINAMPSRWLDLVHEDDRPAVLAAAAALRQKAGVLVRSYRIRNRSGEVIRVEDRQVSQFDDAGRFLLVEGVVFDIGERGLLRAELSS